MEKNAEIREGATPPESHLEEKRADQKQRDLAEHTTKRLADAAAERMNPSAK
jgi:hypothetical protein